MSNQLREALARFDAEESKCPFNRKRTPPTSKPCPTCNATSSESCRLAVSAAFRLVIDARAALSAQVPEDDAGLIERCAREAAASCGLAFDETSEISVRITDHVCSTKTNWRALVSVVLKAADRIEALSATARETP